MKETSGLAVPYPATIFLPIIDGPLVNLYSISADFFFTDKAYVVCENSNVLISFSDEGSIPGSNIERFMC